MVIAVCINLETITSLCELLVADGQFMADEALRKVAPLYNKTYGEDYVILGYKPGMKQS